MNGGPADLVIEYGDGSSPSSLVDITQHVLTFNGITIEALIEEVRSFGEAWDQHLPIGVGKMDDIELEFLHDDSVGGPDDLFADRIPESPSTLPRPFKCTWFGTKTTQVDTFLQKYGRTPDKNEITKSSVVLRPTGAPTEA